MIRNMTSPSPRLSEILFPNKTVEPYSPKGPEKCKNNTISMYWDFLGPHTTIATVISKKFKTTMVNMFQ